MPVYEYKVVPAPMKGRKGKGAKGAPERFALALETVMNDLAAEGWEYLRADTLPSEERSGLTGSTTVFQNMLVFRRESVVAGRGIVPAPDPMKRDLAPAQQAPAAPAPVSAMPDGAAEAPPPEPEPAAPAADNTEKAEAAAAAAAALSAYRDSRPDAKGRPLGPARRRDDDDDDNSAAAG